MTRGSPPARMEGSHPRCPIVQRPGQKHRHTVGHADADHHSRLVGDDPVAFQFLEMGIVGIGGIDHEEIGPVGLGDGNDPLHPGAERTGQDAPVAHDAVV